MAGNTNNSDEEKTCFFPDKKKKGHERNLLVIDDEAEIGESIRRLLKKKCNVFVAKTAEEGLEIVRNNAIHVVLSDQCMPEMTGTDFFRIIKNGYPEIIRMLITGYADISAVIDSINEGHVFRYIHKPWDPRELEMTVEEAFKFHAVITNNQVLLKKLREANDLLEERVKERTETLTTLINAMPDIVCLKDGQGRWIEANPAKLNLFNLKNVDYKGKRETELAEHCGFCEDALRLLGEKDQMVWEKGETVRRQEIITQPDASPLVFDMIRVPLFYEDGAKKGLLVIGRDITDRQKMDDEIRKLNDDLLQQVNKLEIATKFAKEMASDAELASRAKSDFLTVMSHDLRTPLNSILGYAQILDRDPALPVRHVEAVSVIIKSGKHLLMLIEELLDLSKIESGKTEYEPSDFSLSQLLRSITDMCGIQAEKKGLYFHVECDPRIPDAVKGDAKLLSKILLNLIDNGFKFTEKGGIIVKVTRVKGKIRFQVADTGVGIPKENISAIFTPFFHYSRDGHQSGTGLGLAISKKLAGIMHSELLVESKPGQGCVFRFDIDLPETNANRHFWDENSRYEPDETKQEIVHNASFSGKRVLIVDDVIENRAVLRDILEPEGFEMVETDNGKDAIKEAMRHNFDVILMDLMMPEMDGFEAAMKIRETDRLKDVILIAISAKASITTHEACLAAGYDDYVTKPFDIEYLLDKLRQHLNCK